MRLPKTTCVRARTIGATARTAGHSRRIASASCGVRVMMLPLPNVTPPLDAVPGCTSRLFAPMLAMIFLIAVDDPWPISIMVMTAPTPITMPSMVRAERMTLRRRACTAIRSVR